MLRILTILLTTPLLILVGYGQMLTPKHSTYTVNKGSDIFFSNEAIEAQPTLQNDLWMVSLTHLEPSHHPTIVPREKLKILKKEAARRREQIVDQNTILPRMSNPTPDIERNFRGNIRNGSVPMDNSIAVSHNGFIVSGINTNLIFTQPDGIVRYTASLSDFFKILGLGTRMYDPRIIYDTEQRRFIIMCMHGTEANSTALVIAFSSTEDPTGRWNFYKIDGNPLNDPFWSDYPNVSISTKDLFITTLLRDSNGDWNYSMVFQITKDNGYSGLPLRWKFYANPLNADSTKAFNLVPTQNGWDKLIGPGMHLVSNEPLGGDKYNYYQITNSLDQNPELRSYQTKGLMTSLAPNGRQKGSTNILNTFDSRIWSALYSGGIIHMGGHVNTDHGDVGLLYGRYSISDLKVDATILTDTFIDYGFPSFSTFGKLEDSDTILVNYLFSGANTFASQQQRTVTGRGNEFKWSDPITLKAGESVISALPGSEQRWGDYSTACRRFLSSRIESWVVGMHAETRNYATWIGQLAPKGSSDTQLKTEFVADKTTTSKDSIITFQDLTKATVTSRKWILPGAIPSSSQENNPKVTYPSNGAYDVTLIVQTDLGADTLVKKSFIHIQDKLVKPVADFFQDKDTVLAGQKVRFISNITGEVIHKKWTFAGGVPVNSQADTVDVTYNYPGSFLVALLAENTAGVSLKNKSKAVTVIAPSSTIETLEMETIFYPSPLTTGLTATLDMRCTKSNDYTIDLLDSKAIVVHRLYNDRINAGLNRLTFDSPWLKPGVYYIKITSEGKQKICPFLVN